MDTPQPPQNKWRVLFIRLKMAWRCLFGRKVLLFEVRNPTLLTCSRAGAFIGPIEYSNIAYYTQHLEAAARLLCEEKLLADIRAEADRVSAIEAEIAAVLHQP